MDEEVAVPMEQGVEALDYDDDPDDGMGDAVDAACKFGTCAGTV